MSASAAFWIAAALLLAAALACVLLPLRRRAASAADGAPPSAVYRAQREELDSDHRRGTLTDAQHASALDELQRRALAETAEGGAAPAARTPGRASTLGIALALPAAALALYAALGAPQALEEPAAPPHALTRAQVEGLIERLDQRLKAQPDDAEGWLMLARSQLAFGRFAEASAAYERVAALVPANAELYADHADVLAQANGGRLEGRPLALVRSALQLDPAHPKALALAGTAAYERRDFGAAVEHWQRLQRTLGADSEQARGIEAAIAQARQAQREGRPADAAREVPAATAAATANTAAVVGGEVSVAAPLLPRLPADATLFVFARAVEGPRMPLAIVRVPAPRAWPFAFTLDDTQAMTPQAKLSGQTQVMLVARLSRSGDAMPRSGDLTGTIGPVKVGQRGARLVIDGVVP